MLEQPPFPMKQAPGASQPGPMAGAPMDDIDEQPEEMAGEDDQAQRTAFMQHVYSLMAEEDPFPDLEAMLEQDPLNAIADATVGLIVRAEQDLGQHDTDLLQSVAEEVIPQLAELAESQGIDIPEDQLEQVAALAVAKWSRMPGNESRVDPGMSKIGQATLDALGMQPQQAQQQPQSTAPAVPAAAPAVGGTNGQLG
jgi:hypothetical protein